MNKTNKVAAERAAGALAGAWQQNPAVCSEVKKWIDNFRSDMVMAVSLDNFVNTVNEYLEVVGLSVKITREDVYACLKHDGTIRVMDVDGKEVLWLWDGWRLYSLMHKAAKMAAKEGEVAAVAGL
jgi:2',3'-cyclic-nucleotide 2'-phosphodiesterase (5'-nucleotidase family)